MGDLCVNEVHTTCISKSDGRASGQGEKKVRGMRYSRDLSTVRFSFDFL